MVVDVVALIGLATAAVKGSMQLVAAPLSDELNLVCCFKDKLRKLKNKFEYAQAFLNDAGNSRYEHQSNQVKKWVQQVKDAAYKTDNVMDEYAIEIFRRKKELQNQFKKKFCNFFTLSNPVLFHFRIAHKVDEILSLFDEIYKDAKHIGLRQVDNLAIGNANDILEETRQCASADGSKFVGREDAQHKLLDFICSPNNHGRVLPTVAVFGMGGVGKPTLARRLFHHERIGEHFEKEKKIWISVSENFTITRTLNEMVESVTLKKSELSNNNAIISKLEEDLKGEKFLLVLDDVWDESHNLWDSLKNLLNSIGGAPGSVILVTTRSHAVATAAKADVEHKLEGLSEQDSWSLLFHDSTPPTNFSMVEVGEMILDKCKGIPMAIKVIGTVLDKNQTLSYWESIERSEIWNLQHDGDENQILPSLLLSFNHLPSPSLKQCFAYCAVIDKGYYVFKNELIGLWLSQGYLRTDSSTHMTMEEIGEKYLKILLSRSLLEEFPSRLYGIMVYKMHDLVYDLAVHVCGSDLIKEANNLPEIGTCRHLVFNPVQNIALTDVPLERAALSNLRTLNLNWTITQWNMLSHARYLRTLKLDWTGITELPLEVVSLKHLRFLDVSGNPISTLPDLISKLYQLQTLILYGCINMKKLPLGVNKLVNLRHILTTASMLACKGLQQLTNLQTLPTLCLNDNQEGWTIDELGDLDQLKDEIQIQGLEYVNDKEQATKAGLGRKANVTKLNLSWVEGRGETNEGNCDEDVLEGLEPHPNVTSLQVKNFNGMRFPTWITGMSVLTEGQRDNRKRLDNLTMVKLLNCNRCQTLPKLGQLPLLKCLILSGLNVECIGIEFYGGDDLGMLGVESFKCLTELEISGFRRLVTWIDPPEAAFPKLVTLRVKDCDLLKSVPALGIKSLSALELERLNSVESLDIIKYSSGLTSLKMHMLPKIESLPQDLANCKELQVIKISYLENLVSFPSGLESLINLQTMRVARCAAVNFIMDDLRDVHSSLQNFQIVYCSSLRKIPSSLEECTSLETLSISVCPMIDQSPLDISKMRRLWELRISCISAENLRSVLESAGDLPLLRRLEIEGFKDDNEMSDYFSNMTPFLNLTHLTELILLGGPNIKTLPQNLLQFTRITALYLFYFEDLEEIPVWIFKLPSLVSLYLDKCYNLKSLASKEDLERLQTLRINGCPYLEESYAKDVGSEWHTISHIRRIIINDKII